IPARFIYTSAQYCFTGAYLPASASTTWSLDARIAGSSALISAIRQASPIPATMTTGGMVSPGIQLAV
ncbi:hypothetical protein ACP3W1_26570, partial [Salmonella enterica]|uniref:hypothetical protein n=1 Tax=Salmonella enterica TaxID=28901 RepID=UPI003CF7E39D